MAINNFKPFALDPNANVTSQADWEALPALLSGFTAGKASSAQVNKAIRQASFIAAALAQYTANKSGLDVLDDGDLNGFISKMGTAFGKDFQALDATLSALAGLATGANKLPYFTGNDTAAQTDLTSVGRDIIGKNTIADILTYLGLQTIKPDPRSTKIYSPDLKKFLMVSDTIWGMWNGESNAPVALTIEQGGTGETTVDGVKAAFGIDKLQPKGNYADKSAKTPQIFSDAIKAKYGLEIKDASEIGSVSLYAANNEASIHGWSGQKITIPDKAGTMALAGESVSGLRLSSPREVTVTSADAWINFSISEIVVGIYITPTAGGGAWVLNKVKVATLQALINGAWVNVTQ
ncbi:hypothetical protein [Citrobacter sp. RHBSTW-00944]|uniref:hypothetical protein n=1 Tax=Citrobacter sp. RHBSTW-00944 TaxID=2742671 RepID=UPI002016D12B|nr:hypothetical protein [Citrobacter sp. RHBSTW-00944]